MTKYKRGDLTSSHCLEQIDNPIVGIFLTINSNRYQPDATALVHHYPELVFKVMKEYYRMDYII